MDASTSIAAEGELRKAPRIFRVAKFWRRWSLSTKCFCPFHQITAPKSLIVVIHVIYSCRKAGAEIPHSDVASLLIVCKTRPAAATLRSTWLVNVNVLSNHTPQPAHHHTRLDYRAIGKRYRGAGFAADGSPRVKMYEFGL
jgi:hypothetical protein